MIPSIMEFTGDVTTPEGFLAAGIHAGLKREKKDLALIYSRVPAVAAATYTSNRVQAAPLVVTREHLTDGRAQAVIVNSGNANACTGRQGLADAREMAALTAASLDLKPEDIVVASTGVIGVPLPMDHLRKGIPRVAQALGRAGGSQAAEAIMTTDTCTKERAVEVAIGDRKVTLGAIAKGSGMIRPDMATMLCFITTDAAIDPETLTKALRHAVARSFNLITVDGDTSTNDMVVIMSNGLARNPEIRTGTAEFNEFTAGLEQLCVYLAKTIVRDGEGATKLLEVTVQGARNEEDARRAALSVCGSSLVKTALFGEDANWGRIVAALGYSGAQFDPDQIEVYLGGIKVVERGGAFPFDEGGARRVLGESEVHITVNLNGGRGEATTWGCDLSYDYVKINGSYRS